MSVNHIEAVSYQLLQFFPGFSQAVDMGFISLIKITKRDDNGAVAVNDYTTVDIPIATTMIQVMRMNHGFNVRPSVTKSIFFFLFTDFCPIPEIPPEIFDQNRYDYIHYIK